MPGGVVCLIRTAFLVKLVPTRPSVKEAAQRKLKSTSSRDVLEQRIVSASFRSGTTVWDKKQTADSRRSAERALARRSRRFGGRRSDWSWTNNG
jgi:hypothetical protein